MLEAAKIDEIARAVAVEFLPRESFDHVEHGDATDSEGLEAIRVVIVLKPKTEGRVDGDAALDTLLGIQEKLQAAGEPRRVLIEYATIDELVADGDAEF